MAKKIYYIKDSSGYKYTGCLYTNMKAAEKALARMQSDYPGETFSIDYGWAFSH